MAGDSLGILFRVHNWGESHGPAIGVSIEGCPPGIALSAQAIQKDLDRRRPGQSRLTTQRKERDEVQFLSGVYEGKTTGAALSMIIYNHDQRSKDYCDLKEIFRPSHADFTYQTKYGIRAIEGGGRSSARVTAATVAAGALAKKILKKAHGIEILAYVKKIKEIEASIDPNKTTLSKIESNPVRCPDGKAAKAMEELIMATKKKGDSVGGVIECIAKHVPPGWGEPIFDKIEADLAKACLGINAAKGFEIGSGFAGTLFYGSEHNDPFTLRQGRVITKTNYSGGVQGGITNGMPIVFRVAFKPTATILQKQRTVTKENKHSTYQVKGRHDPCVLPRAVPIVEAVTALVLCDHYLRYRGQCGEGKASGF